MKTTMVVLLGTAVTWVFNSASAGEKYIKVDPDSGKPEYIKEKEAANVGLPAEAKLCEITFTFLKEKVSRTVIENGERKQKNFDGYEFNCQPSKECDKLNEAAKKEKGEVEKKIRDQDDIINPPKEKPTPKPPTTKEEKAAKEKKEREAKEQKKKLFEQLEKFKPECTLKYVVRPGGEDPGTKTQLTLDEIKEKKIDNVICECQKMKK